MPLRRSEHKAFQQSLERKNKIEEIRRRRADSWGSSCSTLCHHKPKINQESSADPNLSQDYTFSTKMSETAVTLLKVLSVIDDLLKDTLKIIRPL